MHKLRKPKLYSLVQQLDQPLQLPIVESEDSSLVVPITESFAKLAIEQIVIDLASFITMGTTTIGQLIFFPFLLHWLIGYQTSCIVAIDHSTLTFDLISSQFWPLIFIRSYSQL